MTEKEKEAIEYKKRISQLGKYCNEISNCREEYIKNSKRNKIKK